MKLGSLASEVMFFPPPSTAFNEVPGVEVKPDILSPNPLLFQLVFLKFQSLNYKFLGLVGSVRK